MKMAVLIASALLITQSSLAAELVCNVTETTANERSQYPLSAQVQDADSAPQIVAESQVVSGVQIEVFACPSCSTQDGKPIPQISIDMHQGDFSSGTIVRANNAISVFSKGESYITVNCALGN